MARIATSLMLALLNLLLLGAFWSFVASNHADAAILVQMVLVPSLLSATLLFVIRDFIKPSTRTQAFLAILLSIPSGLLVSLAKF